MKVLSKLWIISLTAIALGALGSWLMWRSSLKFASNCSARNQSLAVFIHLSAGLLATSSEENHLWQNDFPAEIMPDEEKNTFNTRGRGTNARCLHQTCSISDVLQTLSSTFVQRALIAIGPISVNAVQMGHGLGMVKQVAIPVLSANMSSNNYPAWPVAQEVVITIIA
jgi:hypothetical protein